MGYINTNVKSGNYLIHLLNKDFYILYCGLNLRLPILYRRFIGEKNEEDNNTSDNHINLF